MYGEIYKVVENLEKTWNVISTFEWPFCYISLNGRYISSERRIVTNLDQEKVQEGERKAEATGYQLRGNM